MQPVLQDKSIRPPFAGPGRLAGFAAALAAALAGPVLLAWMGQPPKAEVYKGVTREAGKFSYLERLIYEEKGDLDILVLGSSLLRAAVDESVVGPALSRRLGRPARVTVAGVNWPGVDIQYFLLRDLLEQRKVKLLVLANPVGQRDTMFPHVQLFRILRWGDYPDLFAGLSPRDRMSLYGSMTLGAPRQLLNRLRANRVEDWSGEIPPDGRRPDDELGYYGKPFVLHEKTPPALPLADVLYTPAQASSFEFLGQKFDSYQMLFLRRTAELLTRHGVPVLFLNLPTPEDRGRTRARERIFWPDIFGPRTSIIGAPSARLFPGMDEAEFELFYRDAHFNRNGRAYFTRAILPALLELYVSNSR